jgi:hypothetical protein
MLSDFRKFFLETRQRITSPAASSYKHYKQAWGKIFQKNAPTASQIFLRAAQKQRNCFVIIAQCFASDLNPTLQENGF